MTHRGILASTLAAALIACGGAPPKDPPPIAQAPAEAPAPIEEPDTPEPTAEARLSFAEALDKARTRFPDAPAIEVEVEEEDGNVLLEVEFLVDGEIREVYLHPTTGEIVREQTEEVEAAEKATLPKLAQVLGKGEITLDKAIELALAKYDAAQVREIELEVHGDEVILEVEVVQDGKTVAWVHDPKTGEVRGRESDEETHEVKSTQ